MKQIFLSLLIICFNSFGMNAYRNYQVAKYQEIVLQLCSGTKSIQNANGILIDHLNKFQTFNYSQLRQSITAEIKDLQQQDLKLQSEVTCLEQSHITTEKKTNARKLRGWIALQEDHMKIRERSMAANIALNCLDIQEFEQRRLANEEENRTSEVQKKSENEQ